MRKRSAFPLAFLTLMVGNAVVGCGGKDAATDAPSATTAAPATSSPSAASSAPISGQSKPGSKVLEEQKKLDQ